ncbi:hypothetical protein CYMTET_10764 [Cymbomonas tetramitiformis]|uniref:Uncharacterized protein n=1 Tax=Cymbomonas tetramitiformis TaxID=36881 RepID=A0AAE0GNJ7_9CHLO|nr:hypothetical protein CYMTET_10764 [Cymbomonas tetramitiformis]
MSSAKLQFIFFSPSAVYALLISSAIRQCVCVTIEETSSYQTCYKDPAQDSCNILNLSDISLTSSIPTELGTLFNLDTLYLELNSLSGSIPTELGMLSYLGRLNLKSNL